MSVKRYKRQRASESSVQFCQSVQSVRLRVLRAFRVESIVSTESGASVCERIVRVVRGINFILIYDLPTISYPTIPSSFFIINSHPLVIHSLFFSIIKSLFTLLLFLSFIAKPHAHSCDFGNLSLQISQLFSPTHVSLKLINSNLFIYLQNSLSLFPILATF